MDSSNGKLVKKQQEHVEKSLVESKSKKLEWFKMRPGYCMDSKLKVSPINNNNNHNNCSNDKTNIKPSLIPQASKNYKNIISTTTSTTSSSKCSMLLVNENDNSDITEIGQTTNYANMNRDCSKKKSLFDYKKSNNNNNNNNSNSNKKQVRRIRSLSLIGSLDRDLTCCKVGPKLVNKLAQQVNLTLNLGHRVTASSYESLKRSESFDNDNCGQEKESRDREYILEKEANEMESSFFSYEPNFCSFKFKNEQSSKVKINLKENMNEIEDEEKKEKSNKLKEFEDKENDDDESIINKSNIREKEDDDDYDDHMKNGQENNNNNSNREYKSKNFWPTLRSLIHSRKETTNRSEQRSEEARPMATNEEDSAMSGSVVNVDVDVDVDVDENKNENENKKRNENENENSSMTSESMMMRETNEEFVFLDHRSKGSQDKEEEEEEATSMKQQQERDDQLNPNESSIMESITTNNNNVTCESIIGNENEIVIELHQVSQEFDSPIKVRELNECEQEEEEEKHKHKHKHKHEHNTSLLLGTKRVRPTSNLNETNSFKSSASKKGQREVNLFELYKKDQASSEYNSNYKRTDIWNFQYLSCNECRVPLGGQQFVIVDENEMTRRNDQLDSVNDDVISRETHKEKDGTKKDMISGTRSDQLLEAPMTGLMSRNAPYCVNCFALLFGGACEECDKLVRSDLGAMTKGQHERAFPWLNGDGCSNMDQLNCYRCSSSLIGCPFLAALDGKLYCSAHCADITNTNTSQPQTTTQLLARPSMISKPTSQLSIEDLDRRRRSQTLYSEPRRTGDNNDTTGKGKALRHEPLIDYLFSPTLNKKHSISQTNSMRKDKLLNRDINTDARCASQELTNILGTTGTSATSKHRAPKPVEYMNVDCIFGDEIDGSTKTKQKVPISYQHQHQQNKHTSHPIPKSKMVQSTNGNSMVVVAGVAPQERNSSANLPLVVPSRCSPAVSVASNEGTNSDHSGTSSGVSSNEQPPNGDSNCGSIKSHSSCLSSSSMRSSVSSESSSTSSPQDAKLRDKIGKQISSSDETRKPIEWPRSKAIQAYQSVSASLERRRKVQPITELSAFDLLPDADEKLKEELNGNISNIDPFDKLVEQFSGVSLMNNSDKITNQNNASNSMKISPFGVSVAHKQPEAFFYELAQRLPHSMRPRNFLVAAPYTQQEQEHHHQQQQQQLKQPQYPLEINGLPSIDENLESSLKGTSQSVTQRMQNGPICITDQYSTVKKNTNKQQQTSNMTANSIDSSKQVVDAKVKSKDQIRANFFAITSPLLECQTDSVASSMQVSPSSDESGQTEQQQQQANLACVALVPDACGALVSGTKQLATSDVGKTQVGKQIKSVSFDPSVKDVPSNSATMTLGRAASLKSALKSSSDWRREQQTLTHRLEQRQRNYQLPTAYTAYYDENGQRVKLSSVIEAQQQQQEQLLELDSTDNILGECNMRKPEKSISLGRSIWNGAIAKLTGSGAGGQSSRGGRREERKLRQQQQLASSQQPLAIQIQPGSIHGQCLEQPNQLLVGLMKVQAHSQMVNQGGPVHASTSGQRHSVRFGKHDRPVERHSHHRSSCQDYCSDRRRTHRRRYTSPPNGRHSSKYSSRRRQVSVSKSSSHRDRSGSSSSSRSSRVRSIGRRHRANRCEISDVYDSDDSCSSTSSRCSTCSSSFDESYDSDDSNYDDYSSDDSSDSVDSRGSYTSYYSEDYDNRKRSSDVSSEDSYERSGKNRGRDDSDSCSCSSSIYSELQVETSRASSERHQRNGYNLGPRRTRNYSRQTREERRGGRSRRRSNRRHHRSSRSSQRRLKQRRREPSMERFSESGQGSGARPFKGDRSRGSHASASTPNLLTASRGQQQQGSRQQRQRLDSPTCSRAGDKTKSASVWSLDSGSKKGDSDKRKRSSGSREREGSKSVIV